MRIPDEFGQYQCTACKKFKMPYAFSKHILSPDGLQSNCKACKAKQGRERYARAKAAQEAFGGKLNGDPRLQ